MGRNKGSQNICLFTQELVEYNLSKKQFDLLHALVDCEGSISKACKQAECSRKSYYNWTRDAVFQVALDKTKKEIERRRDLLEDHRTLEVEDALYNNAVSGKENSIIFYLKNRRPDKWKNDYIQGQEYTQYVQNNYNFSSSELKDMSNKEIIDEIQKLSGELSSGKDSKIIEAEVVEEKTDGKEDK